jgi:hypothetical protein
MTHRGITLGSNGRDNMSITEIPREIRRQAFEEAAMAAMKAGLRFVDASPVSDPEGTLMAAVRAIRGLSTKA